MATGSSPPVRGTRRANTGRFPRCGEHLLPHQFPSWKSVHPRLCGEHAGRNGSTLNGSSPPVRGTHAIAMLGSSIPRFIPACAGNTTKRRSSPGSSPVHPRLCGEHQQAAQAAQANYGSSPPVRGTHFDNWRQAAHDRFIPACAGNTRLPPHGQDRNPVHPRLCGEHSSHKTLKNKDF